MTESVVPVAAKRAAKRAFIRTTAQAYAASIPTALSAGVIAGAFDDPTQAVLIAASGILSPLLAGAAAFMMFLSQGIPTEYTEVE